MRILIVEDEAKTAAYIRKGLGEHGFIVDVADNGPDGLHLALNGSYDLVLLDVMLPDMSGYEIVERLRADPGLSGVRILLMTARGSIVEKRRGMALGADGFIAKPFELSELRAEMMRLLS